MSKVDLLSWIAVACVVILGVMALAKLSKRFRK